MGNLIDRLVSTTEPRLSLRCKSLTRFSHDGLDSIQTNLQIRWNHPLNSTIRVIVHQKCVKSIRNYHSLKSVTLKDKLK